MKKLVVFAIFFVLISGLFFMVGCQIVPESDSNEYINACLDNKTKNSLELTQALEIASQGGCDIKNSRFLPGEAFCNENTGTWWIDAKNIEQEGCNPACVVDVNTKTAEINWRCTGLKTE